MEKERAIGEVFTDEENFDKPKKIKCVKDMGGLDDDACALCVYHNVALEFPCMASERTDKTNIYFIEAE